MLRVAGRVAGATVHPHRESSLLHRKGARAVKRTIRTLALAAAAAAAAVGFVAACAPIAHAGEWPRFLGPAGTGVVEKGEPIARSWPQGGPKELWSIKVGEGYGGASIADGKVYLLDRRDNKQDIFRVLDLKTGQTVWESSYDTASVKASYPGSRGTPTIDGEPAYTLDLMGQVHCFDLPSKKVVWRKSLADAFNADRVPWGFAQSPLVVRGMVVMAAASK